MTNSFVKLINSDKIIFLQTKDKNFDYFTKISDKLNKQLHIVDSEAELKNLDNSNNIIIFDGYLSNVKSNARVIFSGSQLNVSESERLNIIRIPSDVIEISVKTEINV